MAARVKGTSDAGEGWLVARAMPAVGGRVGWGNRGQGMVVTSEPKREEEGFGGIGWRNRCKG